MKKLLCCLLCLVIASLLSCAQQSTALSTEEMSALREQYPYCNTSNTTFDMSIPTLSEAYERDYEYNVLNFIEVEIVGEVEYDESEYELEPDSGEAALDKKAGGTGVLTVEYMSWKAKVIKVLGDELPDRLYDENGYVTLMVGTEMAFLVPDLKVGEKYYINAAVYNEDSPVRSDKVNELEIGCVFYITDDDFILASLPQQDEYSGLNQKSFETEIVNLLKSQ